MAKKRKSKRKKGASSQDPSSQDERALLDRIQQALSIQRSRFLIIGFVPRHTATLVSKDWCVLKNRQTTTLRVRFGRESTVTDAAIAALANGCHNLTTINLDSCTNITDAAITALANGCHNLTTIDLHACTNITNAAINALRELNEGIHIINYY